MSWIKQATDTAKDKLGYALQELDVIESDLRELNLIELSEQVASLRYEIEKQYQKEAGNA